jgi:putative transposase
MSFGTLRVFDTLAQAKVLVARWRRHCDTVPPHSGPGYRPPTPEAICARPERVDT